MRLVILFPVDSRGNSGTPFPQICVDCVYTSGVQRTHVRGETMNTTTTPTKAAAYLRVSTSKQADHGVSLDAQRAKVEAFARLYDLELVAVIVDAGESAKSLDRPGLQSALRMLRTGEVDALIVTKLDRLTRSVRDLGDLMEQYFSKSSALLSVSEKIDTGSAAGRMLVNILMSVAQWEREAIGERTSAAMQHMKSQGRYTGGKPPYGRTLANDGTLIDNPAEQKVIVEARKLRAAGLSLRAVAAELDRAGHRSRTDRAFAAKQVRKMVMASA